MKSGPSGPMPADTQGGDDAAAVLAERLRFESLVIDLAGGFINVDPSRVDPAIQDCLRRIVEALGLDRSTLYQRSGDDLVVTHSWAAPGFDPFPTVWGRDQLPWCYAGVMRGERVVICRIADRLDAAADDKALASRR